MDQISGPADGFAKASHEKVLIWHKDGKAVPGKIGAFQRKMCMRVAVPAELCADAAIDPGMVIAHVGDSDNGPSVQRGEGSRKGRAP